MIPRLCRKERAPIISSLEQSIEAHQKLSVRFLFAPPELQLRHANFVDLVKSIIKLFKAPVLSETEAPKDAVPQQAEALEDDVSIDKGDVSIEENDMTVDRAAFLHFLKDIELLVGQAVALWSQLVVGKLGLLIASMRLVFFHSLKLAIKAFHH